MINKILNLFGYYSFTQIVKTASVVKKESDTVQYELSKRIQKSYFHRDENEISNIATEVHSINPIGEFLVRLTGGF